MAVIVVAYDGTELSGANAETTDGGTWDKLGVTQSPAPETDIFYEGTQGISNKISNTTGGVDFQADATVDLATTPRVVIAVINCTTYALIDTTVAKGLAYYIGVGASGSDYHEYNIYGSGQDYPARGGFVVIAIDPNIVGYRDVAGTPDLTVAEYFGLYVDITSAVRSENIVHDTLSYVDSGKGITLTRGDAGSTEGVFQDFIDYDEGTVANRRGIVIESEGALIVTGTLTIGSADPCEFVDTLGTVIFPDGRVNAGFFGLAIDLAGTATNIDISNYSFTSNGNETTADTRAILIVTGTTGTATFDKCNFVNFADITLTSSVTFSGNTVALLESMTQAQATLNGNTFDSPPKATGEVFMTVVDPSDLTDNTFISGGNGYAMQATVAGTYSFVGNVFTGYATQSGTATDRAILWAVEATNTSSYASSNQDTDQVLGNATILETAQSFTGDGNVLSRVELWLKIGLGTPSGTMTAEIYAHTGTFGTSSEPTGAVLATSEAIDASVLTGSYATVGFEFKDEFTLVNTTKYVLVLTTTVSDASNYIHVGTDTSSPAPTDNGNFATNTASTWTAVSGEDAIYQINTGGILKLGISGGGSTPSYNITSTIKGTVIAPVSVSITIHTQDADAVDIGAAKVYLTATGGGDLPNGTVVVNDETDGSGDLTVPFTYTNPQDITGWARKSSASPFFKHTPISASITSSGAAILGIMASDE